MTPTFAAKLGLISRLTKISGQKIDCSSLKTYGIITAKFSVEDNLGNVRFLKETFLLAEIKIEVVSRMIFLKLSNRNIKFMAVKLT